MPFCNFQGKPFCYQLADIKKINLYAVTSYAIKAVALLLIQLQGLEYDKYLENTSHIFRGM